MNHTDILEAAESRISGANAAAKTAKEEGIEHLRREIGLTTYERAKEQLVVLERFLNGEVAPFVTRTRAIQQQTADPLPPQLQKMLGELSDYCHSVPRRIRDGVAGYQQLRVPLLPDGRVDPNQCRNLVFHVKASLNAWDGWRGRCEFLMGQVTTWIREVGWPRGGNASPAPGAPESRPHAAGVTVESKFEL
jgi:hypothetical protein